VLPRGERRWAGGEAAEEKRHTCNEDRAPRCRLKHVAP
jgi:hypothetical protein